MPAGCVVLHVRSPGPLGSCSPVCLRALWCCVCGVLGHFDPFHRCARLVRCFSCAVSWARWLLSTGVPAQCVIFLVRCPGPPGSCSAVCPRGLLYGVRGVLDHLAPVHRCARSVRCFACAVSWATRLLFTGVPAWCVVLLVRCPGPIGSCSPVCPLSVLFSLCGVLGHSDPGHRCARAVCCVACAVSWATWLLFTGVPARCVVLLVCCPGPLGFCSPVCPLGVLCCVRGVLGHLAPVHQCASRCVALRVRCPGPLGSWSPVRPLGALRCCCGVLGQLALVSLVCPRGLLCCMCGVLGHSALVHRCACSVRSVACAVSCATWLLFTGAPTRCVALFVRCPAPLGSCSPVCPLGALLHVCGVPGHLAPDHRRARSLRCVACAVSWAPWLLFTCVPARSVVLRVPCPGPLGSCPPVRPLGALLCVCGVLSHLAPVYPCARFVRCVVRAVSWSLSSCSPFCPLGVFCCVYDVPCSCSPVFSTGVLCGVLGLLTPVHRCACSVCCAVG